MGLCRRAFAPRLPSTPRFMSHPYPHPNPRVHRADTIEPSRLDPDAVRVVERLQSAGFEAYLVGGCVRDLLLGRAPKDFDVATDARPRQIRKIFRNCRIIGRRFKLAHVVFRRPDGTEHIIETATFRRAPQQMDSGASSLLIRDDNEFGSAAEDAERRDFTINALFFDPRTWVILDYVGGLEDIARRRIETIGDPNIRLREDPVRILRAVKFASRLEFRIAFDTFDAMVRHAMDLQMAAIPRILEEILRLLRSGHAYEAFLLLARCGALSVIVPEVAEFLERQARSGASGQRHVDGFWRLLQALDRGVHAGDAVTSAYLHSVLFFPVYERACDPEEHRGRPRHPLAVADSVFDSIGQRLRIPRADVARAKEICSAQFRFLARPSKRFRPGLFVEQRYFVEALALFRARCFSSGGPWEVYDAWYQLFRRRRTGAGGPSEMEVEKALHTLERLPAPSATFEELWNLPTRGDEEPEAHGEPAAEPQRRFEEEPREHGRREPRDRGRREHGERYRGGKFRDDRRAGRREERRERAPMPAHDTEFPTNEPELTKPLDPAAAAALEALSASVAAAAGLTEPVAGAAATTSETGGAEGATAESAEAAAALPPTQMGDDGIVRTAGGVPIVFERKVPVIRERVQREPLRFKIARPDQKFEFPAGPMVKIEEGPSFGDW